MPRPPWPAHKTIAADPDLGAVSDAALAAKYEVSREYVLRIRHRLGLKAALKRPPRPVAATRVAPRREVGRRPAPREDAVLAALAAGHSRAMDIHSATREVHWPNTARILRRLVDAGRVVKLGRGRYALALVAV